MSVPMKPGDPAYFMLQQGMDDQKNWSKKTIHSESCYICRDSEFQMMGLPLCTPCVVCGAHVAADDVDCDGVPSHDQQEEYHKAQEAKK